MENNLKQAAAFFQGADDFYILSHQYPDGDTLGSAAALCRALRKMGKRAQMYHTDDRLLVGEDIFQFLPHSALLIS